MTGRAAVASLVLATLAGCGGRSLPDDARTTERGGTTLADFSELTRLATLPRSQVLAELGATADEPEGGYAYEGLTGVTRAQGRTLPAWCFFRGDATVMLYIGDEPWLARHVGADVLEAMGPADGTLASRAGKGARMHVWASRGIAVSVTRARDPVELLEVFPPTTFDTYRSEIWRDPGPFTK